MTTRNGNDKLWEATNQAIIDRDWNAARTGLDCLIRSYLSEAVDCLGEVADAPATIKSRLAIWNRAAYAGWGLS